MTSTAVLVVALLLLGLLLAGIAHAIRHTEEDLDPDTSTFLRALTDDGSEARNAADRYRRTHQ